MNNKNNVVKICIPSVEAGLESQIDSRFGRCHYFNLVEVENGKIVNAKSVENAGASQDSGAGMAAAEQIGNLDVSVVLTSDVGPKSKVILDQLGIKIIKTSGIAKLAIEKYIKENN
jgi:predicted Fe-Mo cluster-binding NifX family protein